MRGSQLPGGGGAVALGTALLVPFCMPQALPYAQCRKRLPTQSSSLSPGVPDVRTVGSPLGPSLRIM